MGIWDRFWTWWDKKLLHNFIALGIILWIQVPHMVWMWIDPVFGVHAFMHEHDIAFAAIDLLEVPAIISWTLSAFARFRSKVLKKGEAQEIGTY